MALRCPDCNQISKDEARVCITCGHTFTKPAFERPLNLVRSGPAIKKAIQESLPEGWVYGGICHVGKATVYIASCPTYKCGKAQTFDSLREMMRLSWQHKPTLRKKAVRRV